MPPAMITLEQFHKLAKTGKRPVDQPVFRLATDDAVEVEGSDRTLRFCFSDETVDRMGDSISASGWELGDFVRNPVALWAHDSYAPPIGVASDVGPEGNRLMGNITFTDAETYDFGDLIYRLLKGRFLRAVSVGFIPLEYSFVETNDRPWGIDFKRQTLLEISVCPIPANPNALGEARAKGIDTRPLVEWSEKLLDGEGKSIITKADLEALRRAAGDTSMRIRTRKAPAKRRATGASEDDGVSGGALLGSCGRGEGDECGMKDADECSVHSKTKINDDDDDEAKMIKLLGKLAKQGRLRGILAAVLRAEGEDPEQDPDVPIAHEDAIRLAHRCVRSARAFHKEADELQAKAMDHLGGVMDAIRAEGDQDEGGEGGEGGEDPDNKGEPDDDDETRARAAKAAARRAKLVAA